MKKSTVLILFFLFCLMCTKFSLTESFASTTDKTFPETNYSTFNYSKDNETRYDPYSYTIFASSDNEVAAFDNTFSPAGESYPSNENDEDLSDNPNGTGPGIGVRYLPLNDSYVFFLLLLTLYSIYIAFRKRKNLSEPS